MDALCVGGLGKHKAAEILVFKVHGAAGEVGEFFQQQGGIRIAVGAVAVDDEFTAHPGHALFLHRVADLVHALCGLQIYVHTIDGIEGVGRAVVPPDVESGPGIRHEPQMVFAKWHSEPSFHRFWALARSASQRASRWRSAAVWALL